jgi:LysM repeat protein
VSDDEFDDLGSFGLPPDDESPPLPPAISPPDPTVVQPIEPGLDPTVLTDDPDDVATRSLEALENLTSGPRRRRRAEPEPAPPEKTRRAAASSTARTRKARAAGPAASPAVPPSPPETELAPFATIERRTARTAARRGHGATPRLVAPVVFLVAVLVLIGLLINSGGSKSTNVTKPGGKKTTTAKPTTTPKTTPTVATTYVVKAGDTISGIAAKYHTTVTAIQALNPKVDPNTLSVGEKLKLPPPGK